MHKLYEERKSTPIDALELILSSKLIYNFPLISYNYDLEIFNLGLQYNGAKGPFKIYAIHGGPPSRRPNYLEAHLITKHLTAKPEDSEEITSRKKFIYDSIKKLGFPY